MRKGFLSGRSGVGSGRGVAMFGGRAAGGADTAARARRSGVVTARLRDNPVLRGAIYANLGLHDSAVLPIPAWRQLCKTSGMNDPRSRILPLLRRGEQLLWVGHPDPRVRFTGADAFLVPFSVLWGGFAVVWEVTAITTVRQPLFIIWGIPFVLLGLYFVFGRFIMKKRRKTATIYALTNLRAIVCTGERSVADSPVVGIPTKVDRSRDRRHVSVTFGQQGLGGLLGMYQNTGLDFFSLGLGQTVAFYDVGDTDGLLGALDRARVG